MASGTRRRLGWLLALDVLSALSACGSQVPEWTKPAATTVDLRHDLADCEREGTGLPPYHFWALNMTYDEARERIARVKKECMQARGWQPVGR
jgi:hypothetical protein